MTSDRYYKAAEVAAKAGITKQRVIQLIRQGDIPAEKRQGLFFDYWAIPADWADNWAREYKKKPD